MSNSKSSPPYYRITVKSRLIVVQIKGQWTLQTDMAYLSDLGETMNAMRGNTWAVLVDMRGWVVPISVSSSPLKSDVNLDRRNQKIECWVVDSPSQGDALLPYFVESGIVPRCFSEISEACACLQNAGYIDKTESIDEINWLVRYLAPS